MTQKIDPVKLKAAAEHLEWVCQQYPNEGRVQGLLQGLKPLIDDAKAGRVLTPIPDNQKLPSQWAVSSEGLFRDFMEPDVEGAYVDFGTEMRGGLSEEDKEINAIIEKIKKGAVNGDRP